MADSRLDPAGFFTFDLTSGSVRARADFGQPSVRVVLLPALVLADWLQSHARGVDAAAMAKLGEHLGGLIKMELGKLLSTPAVTSAPASPPNVESLLTDSSPERVLTYASSVFGLFGWGRLELERWGSALLVIAEAAPELDPYQEAMAALLGGMLSTLSGQPTACVAVDRKRFLVVAPQVAEPLWVWAKRGVGLVSILERLETPS